MSALRVSLVDYGAGNLVSIGQALQSVGADVAIAQEGAALRSTDALVVPGVGAAAPAMARLRQGGLVEPIRRWIGEGRPFLGICLGLQLLFDRSDEDGALTLGVLRGRTVALEDAPTLPHIGWNQVLRTREHALFSGIPDDADFYFVHTFAGRPDPSVGGASIVLAETVHGRPFVSAIATGPLLGVQFHPERSGADGLQLMANFVAIAGRSVGSPS